MMAMHSGKSKVLWHKYANFYFGFFVCSLVAVVILLSKLSVNRESFFDGLSLFSEKKSWSVGFLYTIRNFEEFILKNILY
jgi:hypothetical protein